MIARDIPWRTPVAAFAPLAGAAHAHLLYGAGAPGASGLSAIVADPAEVFTATGDGAEFLEKLKGTLAARGLGERGPAPFSSGLVGFLGYEALKSLEPTIDTPARPYALPDAIFGAYDAAAVFSPLAKRARIVGRSARACDSLEERLGEDEPSAPVLPAFSKLSSNFTRRAYKAAVADIIEQILDGAFYQANISQRIAAEADAPFSPFDLFRVIAENSDAPYSAFLQYETGAVISNSPERFFSDRRAAH